MIVRKIKQHISPQIVILHVHIKKQNARKMKKIIITLLILITYTYLTAQTEIPSKIRVYKSILNTKYEIGQKDATRSDIDQHLLKHNPDALYYFRKGNDQARNGLLLEAIGIGLVLTSFLINPDDPDKLLSRRLTTIGIGAALTITGIVVNIKGQQKVQKSVDLYNQNFGYK